MKIASGILVLMALVVVGCGPYDPKSTSDLAECYKAEFGSLPPTNVKVLNARQMVIRDWGAQWLQLELKEDALESTVLAKGFKKIDSPPNEFTTVDRYTPEWWPSPVELFEYYEHHDWTKGTWSTSWAVLAVNPSSGIAYFRCDRMD